MVLQLIAALLAAAIFIPLARKVRNGEPVRGRFWGFWEMLCLYLRDEVVRPRPSPPAIRTRTRRTMADRIIMTSASTARVNTTRATPTR